MIGSTLLFFYTKVIYKVRIVGFQLFERSLKELWQNIAVKMENIFFSDFGYIWEREDIDLTMFYFILADVQGFLRVSFCSVWKYAKITQAFS